MPLPYSLRNTLNFLEYLPKILELYRVLCYNAIIYKLR